MCWPPRCIVCRPADPEAKGLIEHSHDYLERSFLPGRTFASPADFNTQMTDWLAVANTRTRRALGCAPVDRITADRAAMLALPPVAPAVGWLLVAATAAGSLHPSGQQRLLGAPERGVGRRVVVRADLDRVQAFCDGQSVAAHDRIWATHQTISDPAHVEAAKVLRAPTHPDPTTAVGRSEVAVGGDLSAYGHRVRGGLEWRGRLMATRPRPSRWAGRHGRAGLSDPCPQGADAAGVGCPVG